MNNDTWKAELDNDRTDKPHMRVFHVEPRFIPEVFDSDRTINGFRELY